MSKILVITSSYDKTCDYIIEKYHDIEFFRVDVDLFSHYSISFTCNKFVISRGTVQLCESDCKAIYYRKPSPQDLNGIIDSKYHSFSHKEAYSLIEGIVEAFNGKCLTKPSIMRPAGNKVLQARIAEQVGFMMPKYLMTNDAVRVKEFSSEERIVKPLSTGMLQDKNSKEFVQTNILDKNIPFEALKYSPAYFQQYAKKDYECRVTFIGEQAFVVKIQSENTIDWRKTNNSISYSIGEMPQDIYVKCLNFMKSCKMGFGCFDFIIYRNIWYFLEMNVNGQWAWLEFETGLDISGSVVRYLSDS